MDTTSHLPNHVMCLPVGSLSTNCYIVDCNGGCVVIDPGAEPRKVLSAIGKRPVLGVIVTHGHWDHVGAIDAVCELSGEGWAIGEDDLPLLSRTHNDALRFGSRQPDVSTPPRTLLHDGDVLTFGNRTFKVIACPGHTPGGVTFYDEEAGVAFTGDTLFANSCGRTDFEGGDVSAIMRSLARLSFLPRETLVLSGHGGHSSIAQCLSENPFLMRAHANALRDTRG